MNKIKSVINNLSKTNYSKRNLIALIIIILLPLTAGGIFVVQQLLSQAFEGGCQPVNVKTSRVNSVTAEITFETLCQISASIECSSEKDGVYKICGAEKEPDTKHKITTDTGMVLQSENGYYIKLITGKYFKTIYYVQPFNEFGRSFTSNEASNYNAVTLGECQGEPDFDPKYDINQDDCVNMSDLLYIYN